jgi:orotate phosphoribosyltransferase
VSAAAISLFTIYNRSFSYAFNRKEAKDHGEGGNLVGAPLFGNVIIVDDVITAGTAIRETVKLINSANGAKLVGVVVALDRQERGQNSNESAIQEIEREYGVKVITIVKMEHLIEYLMEVGSNDALVERVKQYRKEYGTI